MATWTEFYEKDPKLVDFLLTLIRLEAELNDSIKLVRFTLDGKEGVQEQEPIEKNIGRFYTETLKSLKSKIENANILLKELGEPWNFDKEQQKETIKNGEH